MSATYYFLVSAWAVTSIIINNFAFRMGQCFLVSIQTGVFIYCLLSLRKVMHRVANYQDENQKQHSAASESVMCVNLLVYLNSITFYGIMFTLSVLNPHHTANCEWVLLSDLVFWIA